MPRPPLRQPPASGRNAMLQSPSSCGRFIRGAMPLPAAAALLLAVSVAALSAGASLAWAAPAPGSAAAQPEPGTACPVPGKITAADGSLRGFAPSRNTYFEVD